MKQVFVVLLFGVTTLFLIGCEEDVFGCGSGPYYADLKIRLTINDENPEAPVTVFLGRFENRDTLFSEVVSASDLIYEMEGGNYYSAAVLYTSGARQILAIDGKSMEITDNDNDCPSASDISLRLKLAN